MTTPTIRTCMLSTGNGLGLCCHGVNHTTYAERPPAVYAVLVESPLGLMEHALCADCTAHTREVAADGEVVAVKTIRSFEKGH